MIAIWLPQEEIDRLRERAGSRTVAPLVASALAAALGVPFPAHVWDLYGVRCVRTREAFLAREGRGLDPADRRPLVRLVVSLYREIGKALRVYARRNRRNRRAASAVVVSALVAAGLVETGPREGTRRGRGRVPLGPEPREKVTVYLSAPVCARLRDAAGLPRHASLSRAALALLERVAWQGAPPARPEPEATEKERCTLSLPAPVVASLRAFAREHVRPLASGILTALALAEAAQKGAA